MQCLAPPGSRSANRPLPAQERGEVKEAVPPHLHAQHFITALDPWAAPDEVAPVHATSDSSKYPAAFIPDSRQAWVRLALAVLIGSHRRGRAFAGGVVVPG